MYFAKYFDKLFFNLSGCIAAYCMEAQSWNPVRH